MSKKVKYQKTIHDGNKKFVGILRNNILTVKVAATAKGQMILAGTYNVQTGVWSDGNRKAALPRNIRLEFEKAFGLSH